MEDVAYHRVVDTSLNSEGASATISDANIKTIADTVWQRKHHQHTDTTTLGGILHALGDSIQTQGWSATAASGGAGAQQDSIFVFDTSGVAAPGDPVNNAEVTVFPSGFSGAGVSAFTSATGFAILNLDASTAYEAVVVSSGFTFPAFSFTTGSGATSNDTVNGYNIDVGSPPSASLKRVYVDVMPLVGYDTSLAKQVKVCAEIVMPSTAGDSVLYDTATGVVFGTLEPICLRANGIDHAGTYVGPAGRAIFDVYPNDGLGPWKSRTKFTATIEGRTKPLWTMTVYLTGTNTEDLRVVWGK